MGSAAVKSRSKYEEEETPEDSSPTISGGDIVRQKIAVHYVVNQVYCYAPVKLRLDKYPEDSPKANKQFIWAELDEKPIDNQDFESKGTDNDWEKHKNEFPPGVSIDENGNVFIAAKNDFERGVKITSDDIDASFSLPAPPETPTLISNSAERIVLGWKPVLGLVDLYEIHYKVAASWPCSACSFLNPENTTECDACGDPASSRVLDYSKRTSTTWESICMVSSTNHTIDMIQCGLPYLFAIRARNQEGWGSFSSPSAVITTTPEPPGRPAQPFVQHGMNRSTSILLQWEIPQANGQPIIHYVVKGGAIKEERVDVVYTGSRNFVLLKNLISNCVYHYNVTAVNDIGSSKTSEYTSIRTFMRVEKAGYVSDWAQVTDRGQIQYLNVETGRETDERPAEMDGPVDPIMEFKKKKFRFTKKLLEGCQKGAGNNIRLNINRDRLLTDSCDKLGQVSSDDLKKKIKIDYIGEEGIDAGGLSKDWFLEFSKSLFGMESKLFCKSGESSNELEISTNIKSESHEMNWYYVAGRLMGKALVDRQLIEMQLSSTVFKQILGMDVKLEDLEKTDPTLIKSLQWTLDNDIDGILFEEFCVTCKKTKKVVDLIPGGRNIEITNENKRSYVEAMLKWRAIDSCKEEIDAIRKGLFEIVPCELLTNSGFDLLELDMLWNGLPFVNVMDIRNNCVFQGGFDANSTLVHWFWKTCKEMDPDDLALLLRFATGTCKIPIDGLDPPFNLTLNDCLEDDALPKAHTCFNQLVLPNYRTQEIMKDKLQYAIQNTTGFLLG